MRWWVGGKIDLDIRNVNLRKRQVTEMEKTGFDRSLIRNDLTQKAQKIYCAALPS
jgi:hypothetical protein